MSHDTSQASDTVDTTKSSKGILIQGFGFTILVIIIMAAVWFQMISEHQIKIDQILAEQNETRAVFTMRDAAYQRALILHRMALLEDEFDRDEEYLLFKEKAEDFIKAREMFLAAMAEGSFPNEMAIWEQALPDIRKGSEVQTKVVQYLLNNEMKKANTLLLNDVVPTQNRVMGRLTELLDEQRRKSESTVKEISDRNRSGLVLMTILASWAVAWGLGIGIHTIKRIKRVEQSLHEARQRAQDADNHKSQFLANMSHEIRTPLTAIIGFSETLMEEKNKAGDWKSYLGSIVRNGKHLHQLINDILDLSKIEANQLSIEQMPVSACQLLAEIDSLMGERARSKGLKFEIIGEYPIPEFILSDPTRLRQILINLCGNAIKFTADGRVTLRVKYQKDINQMEFNVEDSGIGMSAEQISELFKPFKQADASTTRKFGGTGLGLYISKQLSERLGGSLCVESLPGVGSRFSVLINTGDISRGGWINSREEASTKAAAIYSDTTIPRLTGNVLLAEDNPDNQQLISLHINKTGANVTIVENGKLAVKEGLTGSFDLILMDMQMPIMGGIEAIKELRDANCRTPIATLTANAMKEDVEKSEKAGATDFLTKPINKNEFYSVLGKYLTSTQNMQARLKPKKSTQTEKLYDEDIQDLVEMYAERLPETGYRIERLLNAKQWDDLRHEIHQLKGTGGAFGFPEITEQCIDIEQKIKSDNLESAAQLITALIENNLRGLDNNTAS